MSNFFKNTNDSKVKYEVYYGWDFRIQKWFINLKLTEHHNENIIQWFDDKNLFDQILQKIS